MHTTTAYKLDLHVLVVHEAHQTKDQTHPFQTRFFMTDGQSHILTEMSPNAQQVGTCAFSLVQIAIFEYAS
jgi:hypothetical protein